MNKYTQSTYIQKPSTRGREAMGLIAVLGLMIFTGYGAYPLQKVTRGTISVEVAEAKAPEPVATTTYQTKPAKVEIAYKTVKARVTGYNTVEAQTDQTPCIGATGANICGRNDVVACPRSIKLGTKVEIDGKTYVCLDRTAEKFNGRFDISCDKDMACPAKVTGVKEVKIYE